MAEKKKGALAIMFGGPPKEEPKADGEGGGGDEDFRAACDEAFDAVTNGDKAAFCEAMKAVMDIHASGGAYPDDEAAEGE